MTVEASSGQGSSISPIIYLWPTAPTPIGQGFALNQIVQVNPSALVAPASSTTYTPSLRIRTSVSLLTITGATYNPVARLLAQPTPIASTGSARTPLTRVTPNAGAISGAGVAYLITLQGSPAPTQIIGVGTALGPGISSHFYGVGFSTGSGAAVSARVLLGQPSVVAAASGTAFIPHILSAFSGVQGAQSLGSASNAAVNVQIPQNYTDLATTVEQVDASLTGTFTTGTDAPHCLLHHPDREDWAIEHVQGSHDGALWRYGEYSMFVLLWRIEDFEMGLVDRCPECQTPYGAIAEVYKQPMKTRCPTCYGTTFRGGFKAKIVRPAMWDMGEATNSPGERGEMIRATTAVQSTHDFRMRTGDFILRADGTRWHVQSLSTNHLRAGFGYPDKEGTLVGFNYGQVMLEDPTSNAYAIELPSTLPMMLNVRNPRQGRDFSLYEEVRGPLLPPTPAVAP